MNLRTFFQLCVSWHHHSEFSPSHRDTHKQTSNTHGLDLIARARSSRSDGKASRGCLRAGSCMRLLRTSAFWFGNYLHVLNVSYTHLYP